MMMVLAVPKSIAISCVKENNPMYIYDLTIYDLRFKYLSLTIQPFTIYKETNFHHKS